MKTFTRLVVIIAAFIALASCALLENFNHKPSEITALEKAPKLNVKNFFNGDVEVFAITQDEQGKLIGSFTAKMNGKWEDSKGVLQQNFISESGKKDSRTWLVTIDSDGTFDAVGHDVVTPVKGKQIGNAMQMIYTLALSENGVKRNVDYEDNFYLIDERSAIAISTIRKNGMPFGKSIISYKKVSKIDQ